MGLSLNISNKDFDFAGWVIKTSWLIYFRSVKFHYVKETHMMLVALVKIVVASQHKRQRKNLCRDLLRNENTDFTITAEIHARSLANFYYNIARALVLCKSYWAVMNKIFMYAHPCSIKWRQQFHFSCKISVEFSARSFCLSFGNVKIILSNPNPTLSLWLLSGKDVYLNVSILTLFASIFLEYFYFVWLRCFCERKS